jgi:hypothetical protein
MTKWLAQYYISFFFIYLKKSERELDLICSRLAARSILYAFLPIFACCNLSNTKISG